MDIIPLDPGFAAELRGVTLADVAADAAAYRETRAAFEEYSVLVSSHAYAIEGIEKAAGQKLLAEWMDAATAPGLSYVHTWRNGDVVMWDNRATMHRWPALASSANWTAQITRPWGLWPTISSPLSSRKDHVPWLRWPDGEGSVALRWPAALRWPQASIQGRLTFPASRRRRSKMRRDPFSASSRTAQSR